MGRKDIITKSSDRMLVPWGASSSDDTFPRRGTMQKTEQSLTGPHRLNTHKGKRLDTPLCWLSNVTCALRNHGVHRHHQSMQVAERLSSSNNSTSPFSNPYIL